MGLDFNFPRQPDWPWLKATYPGNTLLHVDCPFMDVVRRVGSRMAYLASPYTEAVLNDDLQWDCCLSYDIEARTARWSRVFAIEGVTVASPVLMACAICHADVEGHLDPLDDVFWARWCQPMLMACGAVVIPAMDGWDVSRGVWREACWALLHNVPVYLVAEGSELGGCCVTDMFLKSDARVSSCGRYRHWLSREWDASAAVCGFVMLNPSTADAAHDDPTIRRCIGFARREGCGAIVVANLFQLRATDPAELKRSDDPVGPDANAHILDVVSRVNGPLIAAWGAQGGSRGIEVAALLAGRLTCLGVTCSGAPRHPLYLPADAPLRPYVGTGGAA